MVTLGLSRVDRKFQNPLELVSYLSLLVHSKPHTKAQLEWPKRLSQLDNQLYIRRETYRIWQCIVMYENRVYVSVSHSLILPRTHAYKLSERPHFLGTSGTNLWF